MQHAVTMLRSVPVASWRRGAWWSLAFFVLTGLVTLLLPNPLFTRMTPIVWWDYALWPVTALLVGGFMSLHDARRRSGAACATAAGSGGLAAFLGFSCPVCNHLLLFLMGTGGVLTFVQPYRLHLGLLGVGMLVLATGLSWRAFRSTRLAMTA